MAWYHLYTDITPPPFIWLSHDFLPTLKSKKTSHSYTSLTVSFLSPELSRENKNKRTLTLRLFCTQAR